MTTSTTALPQMPEPQPRPGPDRLCGYSAFQMREYALAAIAAEREACAVLAAKTVCGWQPIATAPANELVAVFWPDADDTEHPERYEFDYLEEGCWVKHAENHEHYIVIGGPSFGPGPSERAPYTHWMRLGTPRAATAGQQP